MLQDCICTTLVARCLQNVWVTPASSFRVVTATNTTAFTRRLSVKYRLAAVSVSLTIKTLPSYCHSLCHMVTRLYSSWQRCAQYGWVLWRAGVPSTTDRMSQAHRAGSKSTLTDHFIGLIRCWQRWVRHTIQFLQYRSHVLVYAHAW